MTAWMKNANRSTFRHFVSSCYAWHNVSTFTGVTGKEKKNLQPCIKKGCIWKLNLLLHRSASSGVLNKFLRLNVDCFTHTVIHCWERSRLLSDVRPALSEMTLDPSNHLLHAVSHTQKRTDMPRALFTSGVVWSIQVIPPMSDRLDRTPGNKDKCLAAAAVTFISEQDETSGFIGISQRLNNGTPGLLSLFHTEQTLPGGVKQSMKLI